MEGSGQGGWEGASSPPSAFQHIWNKQGEALQAKGWKSKAWLAEAGRGQVECEVCSSSGTVAEDSASCASFLGPVPGSPASLLL